MILFGIVGALSENSSGEEKNFNYNTDFGFSTYINDDYLIVRKKQWGNNWISMRQNKPLLMI